MINPVPSSIWGKGKASYGISVNFVVEVEEEPGGHWDRHEQGWYVQVQGEYESMKDDHQLLWVAAQSLWCQVLLDGEVRELYYLMASPVDESTMACLLLLVEPSVKYSNKLIAGVAGPQVVDILLAKAAAWRTWRPGLGLASCQAGPSPHEAVSLAQPGQAYLGLAWPASRP
jgi:hypothetical protein